MSDAASLATLVGAIAAALGALLGVIATKGVDAVLKIRNSRFTEKQYEDAEAKAAYALLITELTARVQSLATDLKSVQHDHVQCIERSAKLEGRDELRGKELEIMRAELLELRKWRHEQANKEQVAENRAGIEKVEQRNLKGTDQ